MKDRCDNTHSSGLHGSRHSNSTVTLLYCGRDLLLSIPPCVKLTPLNVCGAGDLLV